MINHFQHRLEPWLQRLSRPRRFYNGGRWQAHGSNSLFAEQVIGRDHCQYLCLDLSHLPAGKRADALKYQIASHSPWPAPAHQVAWHQGHAQLWIWPAPPDSSASVASHAEPVFWHPPQADGLYLYQCAQGCDLQYWQQGRLQGSQWYSSPPNPGQQQWFARSQGLPPAAAIEPQQPQLLAQPWSAVRVNPLQGLAQQPGGILRWAAFAFILLASVQLTALAQWHWQASNYQKQHEELEQQLGEVLEQRASAREALSQYQRLAPLLEGIAPLHVQYLVTERLAPAAEFEVINWSRQDLQAEITIETASDSTLSMVNALRGEGVKDVQAQPGPRPNQYRLTLQLQPPLPWPENVPHEG